MNGCLPHRVMIAIGGCFLIALLVIWGAWVYVWHGGVAFEQWLVGIIEEA